MKARVTIIDDNGNNKGTYELKPTRVDGKSDIITKYVFEFMYTEVDEKGECEEWE
jgi:hypothetical protein